MNWFVQVGNGEIDHAWWGRPEDMGDLSRPSYKIDESKPGSDLAGETAASLASASILFKGNDDATKRDQLAIILLQKQEELRNAKSEQKATL